VYDVVVTKVHVRYGHVFMDHDVYVTLGRIHFIDIGLGAKVFLQKMISYSFGNFIIYILLPSVEIGAIHKTSSAIAERPR